MDEDVVHLYCPECLTDWIAQLRQENGTFFLVDENAVYCPDCGTEGEETEE